jgi:hypothetical protein
MAGSEYVVVIGWNTEAEAAEVASGSGNGDEMWMQMRSGAGAGQRHVEVAIVDHGSTTMHHGQHDE